MGQLYFTSLMENNGEDANWSMPSKKMTDGPKHMDAWKESTRHLLSSRPGRVSTLQK